MSATRRKDSAHPGGLRIKVGHQPLFYSGPTSMICPGETERRAWVQDAMSGNKSFMRLDFARKTTMDTYRPAMFCWYLILRSLVSSTSSAPRLTRGAHRLSSTHNRLDAPFRTRSRGQPMFPSKRLEGTRRSGFSFPEACQNEGLSFFQCGDGLLSGNAGILLRITGQPPAIVPVPIDGWLRLSLNVA